MHVASETITYHGMPAWQVRRPRCVLGWPTPVSVGKKFYMELCVKDCSQELRVGWATSQLAPFDPFPDEPPSNVRRLYQIEVPEAAAAGDTVVVTVPQLKVGKDEKETVVVAGGEAILRLPKSVRGGQQLRLYLPTRLPSTRSLDVEPSANVGAASRFTVEAVGIQYDKKDALGEFPKSWCVDLLNSKSWCAGTSEPLKRETSGKEESTKHKEAQGSEGTKEDPKAKGDAAAEGVKGTEEGGTGMITLAEGELLGLAIDMEQGEMWIGQSGEWHRFAKGISSDQLTDGMCLVLAAGSGSRFGINLQGPFKHPGPAQDFEPLVGTDTAMPPLSSLAHPHLPLSLFRCQLEKDVVAVLPVQSTLHDTVLATADVGPEEDPLLGLLGGGSALLDLGRKATHPESTIDCVTLHKLLPKEEAEQEALAGTAPVKRAQTAAPAVAASPSERQGTRLQLHSDPLKLHAPPPGVSAQEMKAKAKDERDKSEMAMIGTTIEDIFTGQFSRYWTWWNQLMHESCVFEPLTVRHTLESKQDHAALRALLERKAALTATYAPIDEEDEETDENQDKLPDEVACNDVPDSDSDSGAEVAGHRAVSKLTRKKSGAKLERSSPESSSVVSGSGAADKAGGEKLAKDGDGGESAPGADSDAQKEDGDQGPKLELSVMTDESVSITMTEKEQRRVLTLVRLPQLGRLTQRLPELMERLQSDLHVSRKHQQRAEQEQLEYEADVRRRRARDVGDQLEQYMPPRLLQGLLPTALLEAHDWYQDLTTPRLIRGYPLSETARRLSDIADGKEDPDEAPTEQQLKQQRDAKQFRLLPQRRAAFSHVVKIELKTLPPEHPGCKRNMGSRTFAQVTRKVNRAVASGEEDLVLLSLLHAPDGSQLLSVARTLSRLEPLSHVLAWTKRSRLAAASTSWQQAAQAAELAHGSDASAAAPEEASVELVADLIELPRLKMSLRMERTEDGQWRLYSIDHGKFYVPDLGAQGEQDHPVRGLAQCMPNSLLLRTQNAEYAVVTPNVELVRPSIGTQPFSRALVLNRLNGRWSKNVATRYFTYMVHVSGAFLQAPTLGSALYLLVLRLLARDYEGAVALAGSISSDAALTPEEVQIFDLIGQIKAGHPDFHAVRAKVMLAQADAPTVLRWDVRLCQAFYVNKLAQISARLRLSDDEERRALVLCAESKKRLEAVSRKIEVMADKRKDQIESLIDAERRGERVKKEDLRTLTDFVADCQQTFYSASLATSDEDIKQLFKILQDPKRRGRVDLPAGYEDTIFNREKLLEGVRSVQKDAAAAEPPAQVTVAVRAPGLPTNDGSVWVAHVDASAADDEDKCKSELAPFSLLYGDRTLSRTPTEALRVTCQLFSDSENIRGRPTYRGFLYLYELFTGTKQVVFRGKGSATASHSFAALSMRFFEDVLSPGPMQSILNTMARNPWVCAEMPKWSDTRSDSWSVFLHTRGWSSRPDPGSFTDENPLPRLLFNAMDTLTTLGKKRFLLSKDEPIPPCGFVPPVVLPRGKLKLAHTTDKPLPAPQRPPPSGPKRAKPELSAEDRAPINSVPVALEPCFMARGGLQPVAALRWRTELVKGLQQRTSATCSEQSDYRNAAFTFAESPLEASSAIHTSGAELANLLSSPLDVVSLDQYVRLTAEGAAPTPAALPFDLAEHPEAKSVNARNYLARLGDDLQKFAARNEGMVRLVEQSGGSRLLRAPHELLGLPLDDAKVLLAQTRETLGALRAKLLATAEADREHVAAASKTVMDDANRLFWGGTNAPEGYTTAAADGGNDGSKGSLSGPRPTLRTRAGMRWHAMGAMVRSRRFIRRQQARPVAAATTTTDEAAAFRFELLRHSRHESPVWFEYLVGCMLSTNASADLQKLNPFVPLAAWDGLLSMLGTMLLRANRAVQANAAIEQLDGALGVIGVLSRSATELAADKVRELQLKLLGLSATLHSQRAYCKHSIARRARESLDADEDAANGREAADGTEALTRARSYVRVLEHELGELHGAEKWRTADPRSLVFEFLWNLQLRSRQVDLVLECCDAVAPLQHRSEPARTPGSIVKQMIMGAGKTSVVSPLICLILAQGDYLVVQCVPPALLPQSSAVLRTTFSSVIQKRCARPAPPHTCTRAAVPVPVIACGASRVRVEQRPPQSASLRRPSRCD